MFMGFNARWFMTEHIRDWAVYVQAAKRSTRRLDFVAAEWFICVTH